MDNRSPGAAFVQFGSWVAVAVLVACGTSPRAVSPSSRIGERPALGSALSVGEACTLLPGGAPMGRPDGVRAHRLPPGRYAPLAEDNDGVYFASPTGVLVTEPGARGSRTQPGGIYVPRDPRLAASEYIGDAERVSARQRLPRHCSFALEAAAPPGAAVEERRD
jgi:hypothetical protein